MGYTRQGDTVTLTMNIDDWELLVRCLGASIVEETIGWRAVELANRLNEGNPNYIPYEIPEGKGPWDLRKLKRKKP